MANPAISISVTWLAMAALLVGACEPRKGERDQPVATAESLAGLTNDAFRDRAVAFVREVAAGGPSVTCTLPLTTAKPLQVAVWIFHAGAVVGRGQAAGTALCSALEEATRQAIAAAGPDRERLAQARFVVELPEREYALVEHQGKGVELAQGLVPVRVLDKAMLRRRIDEGRDYLLRVIDAEHGGVHKYYHAPSDSFEGELHTIYTASTIFTLLALHAQQPDDSLRQPIDRASKFLLSMQSIAPGQRSHGAFHYAFDLQRQQPERKFVVGTTSKSIFTLIDLHAYAGDPKYLDAARLAADWLLTMLRPDGRVKSYLRQKPSGSWSVSTKESMLYTGQVLSALSRLHVATGDPKYLGAATQTARYLASKVASEGCYLGDDYRKPNPISSSWVILSLFDFATASNDASMKDMVSRCAGELLERQIRDPGDVYRHGRWRGSLSSSGNGWLAEVMAVLYRDCRKRDAGGCARYHDAIVRVIRLLMQHTYGPESSFVVKNPAMAHGGVFWNPRDRYVRTDSVCHAMNAYVYMIDHLDEGVLIEVPEPPLAERLGLTGAASRGAGSGDAEAAPDEAAEAAEAGEADE